MEIWTLSELKFMEKSVPLPKSCSLLIIKRNFGEKILDVPTKAHGQYFMLPSLPHNVYQKWQTSYSDKLGATFGFSIKSDAKVHISRMIRCTKLFLWPFESHHMLQKLYDISM